MTTPSAAAAYNDNDLSFDKDSDDDDQDGGRAHPRRRLSRGGGRPGE